MTILAGKARFPRLAELFLAGLIFAGSTVIVAIPLAWLWLLSQLDQPYLTVYLLALIGCPAMMIGWSLALVSLNRIYLRLRAERSEGGEVLEASVTIAVLLAALLLATWLLLFPDGGGPVRGPWPG
jgi:hypothetical protein